MSILHEQLQQAHAQQKQKLAETAMLLEEERQKSILDKEVSLDRLRSDMERIIHDLKRNHQQEADATHEKVSTMCEEIDEIIAQFFLNKYTNDKRSIMKNPTWLIEKSRRKNEDKDTAAGGILTFINVIETLKKDKKAAPPL